MRILEEVDVLKVGDIICYTFAYQAEIPSFFQIVSVSSTGSTGKAKLLKTKNVTVDAYGQSGTCVPIKDSFDSTGLYDKDKEYFVKKVGDNNWRIDGNIAKIWNGEPLSFDYSD